MFSNVMQGDVLEIKFLIPDSVIFLWSLYLGLAQLTFRLPFRMGYKFAPTKILPPRASV